MKSLNRVVFQVTKKCNLACAHCFFNSSPNETKRLNFNQTHKALIDLGKLGFKNIDKFIITGGEPTLWPDLLKLAADIRKFFPKSKIRIDTNGISFLNNPDWFARLGADIYDISIDKFHDRALIMGKKRANIFVDKNGESPLVDFFIKNRTKYKFTLSVRWTSDSKDEDIFNKFFKKYNKKVNIERKLVTATGRGENLSHDSINSGYLIKEKPDNFACLMGDSLILAIDGFWYGCYHPVSLTKLGRAGDPVITKRFKELTSSPLYKNLPKQGLLKILKDIQAKHPEHKKAIEKILTKKYWYRCQPCEDLCRAKIFKL